MSDSHLIVLRNIPHEKGSAWVQARRPLSTILKITSKKRHPEFITFSYSSGGASRDAGPSSSSTVPVEDTVAAIDRFLIPQAGEATKCIKQQIIKVLEALET